MGAVAFNTYDFVKSLEDAGMDEKHAAAISAGILRAHEVADLATKADLREVKSEIREELAQLRTDLQAVKQALNKADLLAGIKADLREFELRMTIKFGSMLIIFVGVLTAVIKFL